MRTFKSIQVDDLIIKNGRTWRVVGVHMGCTQQENLIALKSVDLSPGCVGGVGLIDEMHVPEDLIDHACIYRRVDHEAASKGALRVASRS